MERVFRLVLFLLITMVTAFAADTGSGIRVISDPKPTHDESLAPLYKLLKTAEITSHPEDEHFLVRPWNVRADSDGNIYVFDLKVRRFFKFDNNFKLVRVFGKIGQGPGEYAAGSFLVNAEVVQNRLLYFSDGGNRKLIQYNLEGEPIQDIPFPHNRENYLYPLQGPKQNFLCIDRSSNSIQAVDSTGARLYPLLSRKEIESRLLLDIQPGEYAFMAVATPYDTRCAYVADQRLAVFLMNSSTFYLFDRDRLIRKLPVWPKETLTLFCGKVKQRAHDPHLKDAFFTMFNNWFIDEDTKGHFYLEPPGNRDLLRFDLEGKLTGRFSKPCKVILMAKAANRFYGVYKDSIMILEEGRSEK